MKRYVLPPLLALGAILLARMTLYTVDAAEYAYVTVLGKHVATYDGDNAENGAGLKFGWPWPIQQVKRIDRRLQQFDLAEFEQLTHEGETVDKILVLQAYVCWKIPNADAVDDFVKNLGTPEAARELLSKNINSKLGALIGRKRMDDLVSTATDPQTDEKRVDATAKALRKQLLDDVGADVRKYGIELVDIRLRRFNHPGNVRDSIYQRIRSERNKEAAKYLSDGEFEASKKLSEADQEVREKLAAAKAREERSKAEADIEANRIRNEAYSKDPEFYAFLKKMEELQNIVGGKNTMLLLSTHRPMFEGLFTPPRPKVDGPKEKSK